jgi:hypothetical protein
MGRKGRKNCLVIGSKREINNRVAMEVFIRAPGSSITDKQKMPKIMRNRYWPSQSDHECARRERMVSLGSQDVCRVARFDAGDWPLRIRDPNFFCMRVNPCIPAGHPSVGKSFADGDFIMAVVKRRGFRSNEVSSALEWSNRWNFEFWGGAGDRW